MALPNRNVDLKPVATANLKQFANTYLHHGKDYRDAFAFFLDQTVKPSSTDFPVDQRQEVIDFYSQVMNCFANPGSPEILRVVKELELDIRNAMPKAFDKDISHYQTCVYGEYLDLLWPITEAKMLDPLELDHCLARVLIHTLQSIGFNQNLDHNHYPVPQTLGVIPSVLIEELLSLGVWFKEFSASPEGDTSRHGAWSHCIQIYFIIKLVRNGVIKLPGEMALPDLLKACVTSLKNPKPILRNIFDLVFEQRDQADVIESIAKREQILNRFHAAPISLLFDKIGVRSIPTQIDALINEYPYSHFSLCSPVFLSSYLSVINRYVKTDLTYLNMLWNHKMVKLNFHSTERNLSAEVNQDNLKLHPQYVASILNSEQYFFKNASNIPDLSKVDRSKFDPDFLDEANNKGIFYRCIKST